MFINEVDDFAIVIPPNDIQEELDRFMAEQELAESPVALVKWLVSQLKAEGKQATTCCFTGHRPKKIPWLADEDDYRMRRLRRALQTLIKDLVFNGVKRFVAGNAEGFDTIAAETVVNYNIEFEAMKAIEIASEGWDPIELEIAIPFEGHNADIRRVVDVQKLATVAHVVSQSRSSIRVFSERNEYMVDHADMVIALLDDKYSCSVSGGTSRTIAYAEQQGKPVITFYAHWLEDGWPSISGVDILTPPSWLQPLV